MRLAETPLEPLEAEPLARSERVAALLLERLGLFERRGERFTVQVGEVVATVTPVETPAGPAWRIEARGPLGAAAKATVEETPEELLGCLDALVRTVYEQARGANPTPATYL